MYSFESRLFWRGCRALLYLLYFKITNTNVVSRFRTMLDKFPDRVMYVNATNDEEWTFQQVKWWFEERCILVNYLLPLTTGGRLQQSDSKLLPE